MCNRLCRLVIEWLCVNSKISTRLGTFTRSPALLNSTNRLEFRKNGMAN